MHEVKNANVQLHVVHAENNSINYSCNVLKSVWKQQNFHVPAAPVYCRNANKILRTKLFCIILPYNGILEVWSEGK